MICRGYQQRWPTVSVDHLQYGVNNSTKFTMVRGIIAILRQAVEFVKEDDEGPFLGKVHYLAEIGGCLAQKARDDALNSYGHKSSSQLPCHRRRDARLAAARWTIEEDAITPGYS